MTDLIQKAIDFATERHKDQVYDGGPYTKHLRWVAEVAERYGCVNEEIFAACWLHDTVEDTATTNEEIASNFGARVADLVYRVTNEPGRNRRERHERTYGKIKADKSAMFIKLCDRIANVEASHSNPSYLSMYAKEWEDFRRLLYVPGTYDDMWNHIATLLNKTL